MDRDNQTFTALIIAAGMALALLAAVPLLKAVASTTPTNTHPADRPV